MHCLLRETAAVGIVWRGNPFRRQIHYPGFEAYLKESETDYKAFQAAVRRVFVRFGINTEAELLLGLPRESSEEQLSGIIGLDAAIKAAWKALQSCFRLRFDSHCDPDSTSRLRRASAWYYVAYKDKNKKESFRSFPWIMSSHLLEILQHNGSFDSQSSKQSDDVDCDLAAVVGSGAMRAWTEGKELLIDAVRNKRSLFTRICNSIRKSNQWGTEGLDFHLFGSVSLLLCDHGSDIDIFASIREPRQKISDEDFLRDIICPSVGNIATFSKFISSSVPIGTSHKIM